jgi:hypothetical protein
LVVLHVSGDGLPALSIPSVHMTTVGSGSIAVPDFVGLTRTALERGKTPLDQTRLAFHEPSLRPSPNASEVDIGGAVFCRITATHLAGRAHDDRAAFRESEPLDLIYVANRVSRR